MTFADLIKGTAALACILMAILYSTVDESWLWRMVLLLCAAILVAGIKGSDQ